MQQSGAQNATRVRRQRLGILAKLEHWLELPMVVLGVLWLALLVVDFATDSAARFQPLNNAIWVVFVIDYTVKLALAPEKGSYIRRNWLTLIALVIPAVRVFRLARALRVLRLARTARGLRLLRVLTSVNRGMNSFGRMMRKRGLPYLVLLTFIVTFAGAAGMYAFEKGPGFDSYSEALWWTAMIVTTMGSEAWPKSAEGRTLCLLLALYAFTVFGYVTAALASFFVDRDRSTQTNEEPSPAELMAEMQALRHELQTIRLHSGDMRPGVTTSPAPTPK